MELEDTNCVAERDSSRSNDSIRNRLRSRNPSKDSLSPCKPLSKSPNYFDDDAAEGQHSKREKQMEEKENKPTDPTDGVENKEKFGDSHSKLSESPEKLLTADENESSHRNLNVQMNPSLLSHGLDFSKLSGDDAQRDLPMEGLFTQYDCEDSDCEDSDRGLIIDEEAYLTADPSVSPLKFYHKERISPEGRTVDKAKLTVPSQPSKPGGKKRGRPRKGQSDVSTGKFEGKQDSLKRNRQEMETNHSHTDVQCPNASDDSCHDNIGNEDYTCSELSPKQKRMKKSRMKFTLAQQATLQTSFEANLYPTAVDLQNLSAVLQAEEHRVQNWFQTMRSKLRRSDKSLLVNCKLHRSTMRKQQASKVEQDLIQNVSFQPQLYFDPNKPAVHRSGREYHPWTLADQSTPTLSSTGVVAMAMVAEGVRCIRDKVLINEGGSFTKKEETCIEDQGTCTKEGDKQINEGEANVEGEICTIGGGTWTEEESPVITVTREGTCRKRGETVNPDGMLSCSEVLTFMSSPSLPLSGDNGGSDSEKTAFRGSGDAPLTASDDVRDPSCTTVLCPPDANVLRLLGVNFSDSPGDSAPDPSGDIVPSPIGASVPDPSDANVLNPLGANVPSPFGANVPGPPGANVPSPFGANVPGPGPPGANVPSSFGANVPGPPPSGNPPSLICANVAGTPCTNVLSPFCTVTNVSGSYCPAPITVRAQAYLPHSCAPDTALRMGRMQHWLHKVESEFIKPPMQQRRQQQQRQPQQHPRPHPMPPATSHLARPSHPGLLRVNTRATGEQFFPQHGVYQGRRLMGKPPGRSTGPVPPGMLPLRAPIPYLSPYQPVRQDAFVGGRGVLNTAGGVPGAYTNMVEAGSNFHSPPAFFYENAPVPMDYQHPMLPVQYLRHCPDGRYNPVPNPPHFAPIPIGESWPTVDSPHMVSFCPDVVQYQDPMMLSQHPMMPSQFSVVQVMPSQQHLSQPPDTPTSS